MIRWQQHLWRILGSRQLAVILLAALLLVLLLVSLFPQIPAEPGMEETWLEAVALRYGPATDLLNRLGMFEAYGTWWFLALLTALMLNTLICTGQRLPRTWRSLTGPPVVQSPEAFYQSLAHRAEWTLDRPDQGLAAARDVLVRRRFHPHIERDEKSGCASLYVERGRWSQAGTLVSHFAALLLVIAVACRPALSWQERDLTLLPGQVYHVGRGFDLDVRAGELTREHQLGVPLAVLGDTSAITRTVGVNQPLTFRGVAFHLQGYGPAVQITAPEGGFGVAFSSSQAQQVALPEAGLTLRVAHRPEESALFVEALATDGALLGSGSIASGQEIEIEGLPITFNPTNYTVWQVSRDPTFGIVLTGAVLLLVAVVISLWVPHRRLWFRVDAEGSAWMVGAGDWSADFDGIAAEIISACSPEEGSDG